jgi:type I restriction enzyme M protein
MTAKLPPSTDDAPLPSELPPLSRLKPCDNLLAVFEDCHNHIYANEGLLKEKIFHEIVKLLLMKLSDEQHPAAQRAQFGITEAEYAELRAGTANGFWARTTSLFTTVKREHPSLFSDDSGFVLRPLTLAHVIGKLQPFSLTRTAGDVKGKAFQAFVSRHQRGDRGEFFTPHPIVQLAVAMMDPQPAEKVVDPCCGSGGFLLETIAHVAAKASGLAGAKTRYIAKHIRGMEFNPDVVQAAMLQLAFEGGSGGEVLCQNALLDPGVLAGTFDVVLTNPPFGTKGKVTDAAILKNYDLAHKWQRHQSGWKKSKAVQAQTPDVLFLEQSLKLLRPGGRLAVVLPDGILQNASGGYVRAWLKEQAEVRAVISMPPETFLPFGTGIKTSLVALEKLPVARSLPCFMARIERIGYDMKGQPIFQKDEAGRVKSGKDGEPLVDNDTEHIAQQFAHLLKHHSVPESETVFCVPQAQVQLRLDVEHYLPGDRRLVEKLRQSGANRLDEVADIVTNIDAFRTSADETIRYIAISNLDARTMQVVSQIEMKAHEAPSRASYRLQAGDIVTAIAGANTGTIRQATALITDEEAGAICSNGLAVLRNVRGVEPLFFLAYLRTGTFLKQVRRRMTGHAIPAISQEELANILVPVPPKARQLEIAQEFERLHAMRRDALKAGEALVERTEQILDS